MTDKKYTICLPPKTKTRYIAGPYDKESQTPLYTYKISIPNESTQDVKVIKASLPSGDCVFEFHNTSTQYEASISIYNDGVLIPPIL